MTKNDELRGLEIRFYLIFYEIIKITNPPAIQNAIELLDFLQKLDFTNTVNYDKLKVLIETIFSENTNIQPNTIELCNFCYTHKLQPKYIRKYIKLPERKYKEIISRINSETFYQPTHLQKEMYEEIKNFLKIMKKIQNLGVEAVLCKNLN